LHIVTEGSRLTWIVLTMGDRWPEVDRAVSSLLDDDSQSDVVLVLNGVDGPAPEFGDRVRVVALRENQGVPGGRSAGMQAVDSDVALVGFLDDDARLASRGVAATTREMFRKSTRTAVVSFRIQDETGATARRHVPRPGHRGFDKGGRVSAFLGGACVVRRSACDAVGGYWSDLFYSHEELDLSWRLIDAGHDIVYEPDCLVDHPKTDIARHHDGWHRTGRNRVWVARRNLPGAVCLVHTLVWLPTGLLRAPRGCRGDYWRGWLSGWTRRVERSPMSWRTVLRLTRLGRPPII